MLTYVTFLGYTWQCNLFRLLAWSFGGHFSSFSSLGLGAYAWFKTPALAL